MTHKVYARHESSFRLWLRQIMGGIEKRGVTESLLIMADEGLCPGACRKAALHPHFLEQHSS